MIGSDIEQINPAANLQTILAAPLTTLVPRVREIEAAISVEGPRTLNRVVIPGRTSVDQWSATLWRISPHPPAKGGSRG